MFDHSRARESGIQEWMGRYRGKLGLRLGAARFGLEVEGPDMHPALWVDWGRGGAPDMIERFLKPRHPKGVTVSITNSTSHGNWVRHLTGLIYLGIGCVFGVFSLGLLSAVDGMDDYYYVSHSCASLECAHGTKTAPDGRVHCAKYPPKDIRLSEVPASYVKFCQAVVALGGAAGLGFAALTAVFGAQWLFTGTPKSSTSGWRLRLRQAAPFGAVLLPAFAALFLWPYGFVPM